MLLLLLDDETACCEPVVAADHRETGNSQVDGVTSVLRLKIKDFNMKSGSINCHFNNLGCFLVLRLLLAPFCTTSSFK